MKAFLSFLAILLLMPGCSDRHEDKSGSHGEWYRPWIEDHLAEGASFHSEFPLKNGEVRWIELSAETPTTVGFVVKDGYEVFKSGGQIFMGTDKQPHMIGGSPGVGQTFTPVDRLLRVRFENTSGLDTRIAVYIGGRH